MRWIKNKLNGFLFKITLGGGVTADKVKRTDALRDIMEAEDRRKHAKKDMERMENSESETI